MYMRLMFAKSLVNIRFITLALACFLIVACESDKKPLGTDHDFGSNSSDLVLAIGDSITAGKNSSTSYPSELALMIGKTVVNLGVNGAQSSYGASRINSYLFSRRPGFVVIMYGTNDATLGRNIDGVVANVRHIVQSCQRNQSIPILCTLSPQTGSRVIYQGRVEKINRRIRDLSKEENCIVADVAAAFVGQENMLIGANNLHPNELGAIVIAETIAKVFHR